MTLTWLCWVQLAVTTVRAQEPAPASSSEPAPARIWHPKRFGPLYPRPKPAAPQAQDSERAPEVEKETPERPQHTGLLIGGVLMFASSYLVAVVAAGFVRGISQSDCDEGVITACNKHEIIRVPVVGPFLSTQPLDVQLILGVPQILGVVLTIAGIYQASRPVRSHERASFDIYPTPLPTGGMLTGTLKF